VAVEREPHGAALHVEVFRVVCVEMGRRVEGSFLCEVELDVELGVRQGGGADAIEGDCGVVLVNYLGELAGVGSYEGRFVSKRA
jgi:hypothetical protein